MIYPNNSYRDQFYANSDATIEKGDFVRIQDINVSYSPSLIALGNYKLKNPVFYVNCNNLGIIWRANKIGVDPDYGPAAPAAFSISFGFKSDF
jgi:hypothetical protein